MSVTPIPGGPIPSSDPHRHQAQIYTFNDSFKTKKGKKKLKQNKKNDESLLKIYTWAYAQFKGKHQEVKSVGGSKKCIQ